MNMKENNKSNKKQLFANKINQGLSIVLMLFATFGIIQNISDGISFYSGSSVFGMILGLIIFVSSSLNIKRIKVGRAGKTIADERSKRAAEKAGFLAFLLIILILLVSGMANVIFSLNLEYTSAVYAIMAFGVIFWLLFSYYIDRKGDV